MSGTCFHRQARASPRPSCCPRTWANRGGDQPHSHVVRRRVSGETITGKIYRYVTWRDENCASGCDGTQNTKRVTVAVTIDAVGSLAARVPVFLSQVIPNPQAIAPGSSVRRPVAGTSTLTAQDFYLYDTRCGNDNRQNQSGEHSTHNTASWGPPTVGYSVCENTTSSGALQPDLMGTTIPPGDISTPLYTTRRPQRDL